MGKSVRRWSVSVLSAVLVVVGLPLVASAAQEGPPSGREQEARPVAEMVTVDKEASPDYSKVRGAVPDVNAGALSPATEPTSDDAPPTALDDARGRAAATGERQEVPELRRESGTVFAEPDGSVTDEIAAGPVWAQGLGGFVPVDTTLKATGDGWAPVASVDQVHVAPKNDVTSQGSSLVEVTAAGAAESGSDLAQAPEGSSVAWSLPGELPEPIVSGSTAVFAKAATGADVVVSVNRTGAEVSLVIPDPAAAAVAYELDLTATGLTARQGEAGGVVFTDPEGVEVGYTSAPGMFDSTPGDGPVFANPGKVTGELVDRDGGQVLVITPDRGYLQDPGTVFPVTIDPSTNLTPYRDTQVLSGYPNTAYDGSTTLGTGWVGSGAARSLIRFPTSSFAHKNVTSASVKVWQNWSNAGSCTSSQLVARDTNYVWSGATWNTQPTIGSTNLGAVNTSGDPTSCPTGVGTKTIPITAAAQAWAAQTISLYESVALMSDESPSANRGKGFDSAEGAHPPVLAVSYYTTPVTPSVSPTNGATIDTLAPTFKATASGGDAGATLTTTFTLTDASAATVASHTATSPAKTSTNLTWAIPGDLLRPNSSYTLAVKTCTSAGTACSATVSNTYTVNPALGAGDRPYFTYNSFPISDRAGLKVNVASGNLVIANNDMSVGGPGPGYRLSRTFNSTTGVDGGFGRGWSTAYTGSERLVQNTADGSITYWNETGTASLITPKTGGGYNVSGDVDGEFALSGSEFVLRFHHDRGGHRAGDQSVFFNFGSPQAGLLKRRVDMYGNSVDVSYVGATNQVDQVDDTVGRPFEFTYTSGKVTAVDDTNGYRDVAYQYDANGDLRLFADSEGGVTLYDFYDGNHNPQKITGPGGNIIYLGYDAQSRVVEVNQYKPGSPATNVQTWFDYDDTPNAAGRYTTVVSDPNSHDTTYESDNANRVQMVTDADGGTQANSYDINSNVISVTSAANTPMISSYATNNNLMSSQTPTGARASYTYNSTSSTNPISEFQTNVATNPQGRTATFSYSTSGAPLSATNGLASQNNTSVTRQGVNSVNCNAFPGQVCTTTDPRGKVTSYTYDAGGNVTDVDRPSPLGNVDLSHDAVARVRTVTDGNNDTLEYYFNKLDRVYYVDSYPTTGISYVYDDNGNVTQRTDLDNSVWDYTYDEVNRLLSSDGPNESVDYTYDKVGNLLQLDDANGTTTYTWGPVNQLGSVTDPNNTTTYYAYDPDHPTWRTAVTYDSGVEMEITYDQAGRTSTIEAFNTLTVPETKLTSFAYTYTDSAHTNDPTTNDTALRKTVTDINGAVTTYDYDAVDRLATAYTDNPSPTADVNRTWAYDGSSNVTATTVDSVTTGSWSYNDANQINATGVTYNSDGDLTASNAGGYSALGYNELHQTTTATPTGASSQAMSYAGSSQDHLRTIDTTQLQTAGSLGIVQTDNGTTAQTFTREPSGTLVSTTINGDTYNYIYDGQGSVVALTDDTAAVANTYTYDPYGRRLAATGIIPNPFQYASGYTNTDGTTYKYGTRWYDTTTLAWTQRDPAGQSQTYTYVDGNPVNRIDPSGRIDMDCGWSEGGCMWKLSRVEADKLAGALEVGAGVSGLVALFSGNIPAGVAAGLMAIGAGLIDFMAPESCPQIGLGLGNFTPFYDCSDYGD